MLQATLDAGPRTATPPPDAMPDLVDTRFGPVPVDPARILSFPVGLLGFVGRVRYVLSSVPERRVPFQLLQALDDPALGFLVVPLEVNGGPIAAADLEAACQALAIERAELAMLGIVTLRAEPDGLACTVNLRAPLLIDAGRRLGWQYVLASDAYDLRHPLPLGVPDGR